MAIATDAQVQTFTDDRIRPHSERIRNLYNALKDDKVMIDDVYAAWTQQNPTWTDSRTDVPHVLTNDDGLAWNAFVTGLLDYMENSANFAIVRKACVQKID